MAYASSSSGHSSTSSFRKSYGSILIPHRGALCRVEGEEDVSYLLEIHVEDGSTHELQFTRNDFEFALRLFSIMDSESREQISKSVVKEFVTLRCPVFWRRDEDLRASGDQRASPTFEEVWKVVATSSLSVTIDETDDLTSAELGVEGWMVFCRFIALAQYLEAKRRFSGRHLQQTMRHRNSPRGSELVVIDVPPVAAPIPLSTLQLARYEREGNTRLPLPELDLDHSLLAAHDILRRRKDVTCARGHVKVDLFDMGLTKQNLEFCLTLFRSIDSGDISEPISVRRSLNDLEWLNQTLNAHRTLGGTLCGRILPPFSGRAISHFYKPGEETTLGTTSDAIAAAANASVSMLKSGIKSIWGNYVYSPKMPARTNKMKLQGSYKTDSPAAKARQIERYLNYLLEHPALSTSFPLNTMLKASQSGLEAAKHALEVHMRASQAISENTPKLEDGSNGSFWLRQGSTGSLQPNLSWVRTAAQAAVALQLHDVLETTGMTSASARLQHASLPKFESSRDPGWMNDDRDIQLQSESDDTPTSREQDDFEEGVKQVQDCLDADEIDEDNGYDLLPLPVPATERRILTYSDTRLNKVGSKEIREERFRYDENIPAETLPGLVREINLLEGKPALLGDIAVDENIDKLTDVIGSVDHTLSRCLSSSDAIGKAQHERIAVHLDVVRGLDRWEGLRGKFIAQRAILKGVSGIEQSREIFEESDTLLFEDISWQSALAHSAVSAAEDVRSTVRAAKTASSAKTAASNAAISAQIVCDTGKFKSVDDARAAQTRSSIAQSHAIHAAVVEHESKSVKRRATLALAHDVKCWNAHRKRELIETALRFAKSQHEATRRAVDAWSCLRDGYVGSTIIPSSQTKRIPSLPVPGSDFEISDDVEATIFAQDDEPKPTIVPVQHELLNSEPLSSPLDDGPAPLLPLVVASSIPEEDSDFGSSQVADPFGLESSQLSHALPITAQAIHVEADKVIEDETSHSPKQYRSKGMANSGDCNENETLTSSMQSLVNGLMTWGGQYDCQEDFALPSGMAASIALEESTIFQ